MSLTPMLARLLAALLVTGTVACRDFQPRMQKTDAGSGRTSPDAGAYASKDATTSDLDARDGSNSDLEGGSGSGGKDAGAHFDRDSSTDAEQGWSRDADTDDSDLAPEDSGDDSSSDGIDDSSSDDIDHPKSDAGAPRLDGGREADAGEGDDGNSNGPADASADSGRHTITVQGHLIDFWHNRLPGIEVHIGPAKATTDADGAFTIAGVTPPYDASFIVRTVDEGGSTTNGWLYEGLTRADPTLQVRTGLGYRTANVRLKLTNLEFPLNDSEQAGALAWGNSAWQSSRLAGWDLVELAYRSARWQGPAQPDMNVHALLWTHANDNVPNGYLAHATQPLPIRAENSISVSLDLKPLGLPHDHVSGTIVSPVSSSADHRNLMNLDFADGASMYVLDQGTTSSSFDYLVPKIAGLTATVGASAGDPVYPPYALAYRRGIVPGSSGISLTIPEKILVTSPPEGAKAIDEQTEFRWSGNDTVHVLEVNHYGLHYSWNVVTKSDHHASHV